MNAYGQHFNLQVDKLIITLSLTILTVCM